MASIQREPTHIFHVIFRYRGKRIKRSLKTKSQDKANACKVTIQETIDLIERGRLKIPNGVDPVDFIFSDGQLIEPEKKPTITSQVNGKAAPLPGRTLQSLFDQFFASIPEGNLEDTTLDGMHKHKRHLLRILKPSFQVQSLTLPDLQRYVNTRAKEKTQFRVDKTQQSSGEDPPRTNVTGSTIKKELVTLGTVWRWAESVPLVKGSFPRRGLRFPKTQEGPPFQTWEEIERQIEQNQLTGRDASLLWDALYLRRSEIDDLLDYVKTAALYHFIHPMFVMAAHTGARRSELLRSRRADFNFDADMITLHERKRVRGELTTRRVPMSPTLRAALLDWFSNHHPGGPLAFCHSDPVRRSRTHTSRQSPVTPDQAHDHFQRTLKSSKWEKVRGWHCFRHSFISNLACEGIDQRLIDEFAGHTTEQMRRRYRHLFPDVKQAAIEKVFG